MNFNQVTLGGRLTRDIETRAIGTGTTVANFGLAINRKWKDVEEVLFIDCEAWGRTAEVMTQYLEKGREIFIEGRLKLDTWQDKDGGKRSKLKVVVENFQFVGGRGEEAPKKKRPDYDPQSEEDSDLPF